MTDISNWNYYYNWEVDQNVRANLVYTALVSPDNKTFCMDFNRQLGYHCFPEWTGNDFLMQRMENNNILPNWQDQWLTLLTAMWDNNIAKISIHPNSWTVKDGQFIPLNWFFCYPLDGEKIKINSIMMQISAQRKDKLASALAGLGFDLNTPYTIKEIQTVALNSFRANYPAELIDKALNVLQKY